MPKNALPAIDFRSARNPHGLRFAEGDGTGESGAGADGGSGPAGSDSGSDAPQGDSDKGFPEGTPIAEMTDKQQAAYWKFQSRRHEQTAKDRSDYADIKAKAEKFDQAQRDAETEHEKALREAREAALNEGREEATKESRQGTIRALLDVALRSRGQDDTQVEDAIRYLNLDAFVDDKGDVDTRAILAHANKLAGAPGGNPDYGNGRRGGNGSTSGVNAGREMFTASKK